MAKVIVYSILDSKHFPIFSSLDESKRDEAFKSFMYDKTYSRSDTIQNLQDVAKSAFNKLTSIQKLALEQIDCEVWGKDYPERAEKVLTLKTNKKPLVVKSVKFYHSPFMYYLINNHHMLCDFLSKCNPLEIRCDDSGLKLKIVDGKLFTEDDRPVVFRMDKELSEKCSVKYVNKLRLFKRATLLATVSNLREFKDNYQCIVNPTMLTSDDLEVFYKDGFLFTEDGKKVEFLS